MGYNKNQGFISSQPPLIVFTICLAAFGFTMIVLAYVVGETEIPNPDVQMDWNKLLQKMTDLKLCPLQNSKHSDEMFKSGVPVHSGSVLNSSHVVDNSKSMSAVLSDVVDSALMSASPEPTFVLTTFKVQLEVLGNLPSFTHFNLKSRLKGKLLGFPGKYSQILFNVSMSFHGLRAKNSSCIEKHCTYLFDVCISMRLPADLLPKMKGPDECKIKSAPVREVQAIFSTVQVMDSEGSRTTCIELDYTPDVKLTEMLTPQDRSIVNLHLMHTSYFMFVMVMTLVGYSLIRGRYRQPKTYFSLQKVPLDA